MPTEAKILGVSGAIWLAILLGIATAIFARRMIQLLRVLAMGRKENRLNHLGLRTVTFLKEVMGQSRMLKGEYVVTKDDVVNRRHFSDSVCRGRDYYTPYRALLPKKVDQLIVAGRHYSAEPDAQKRSREIPPCMAQGEAAGIAASLALQEDILIRDVDATRIQKQMRAQGADPGDVPSANATGLDDQVVNA